MKFPISIKQEFQLDRDVDTEVYLPHRTRLNSDHGTHNRVCDRESPRIDHFHRTAIQWSRDNLRKVVSVRLRHSSIRSCRVLLIGIRWSFLMISA